MTSARSLRCWLKGHMTHPPDVALRRERVLYSAQDEGHTRKTRQPDAVNDKLQRRNRVNNNNNNRLPSTNKLINNLSNIRGRGSNQLLQPEDVPGRSSDEGRSGVNDRLATIGTEGVHPLDGHAARTDCLTAT